MYKLQAKKDDFHLFLFETKKRTAQGRPNKRIKRGWLV